MQDAHEFLNFLLNELADILEKESHKVTSLPQASSAEHVANGVNYAQVNGFKKEPLVTLVHKYFQVTCCKFYCSVNLKKFIRLSCSIFHKPVSVSEFQHFESWLKV